MVRQKMKEPTLANWIDYQFKPRIERLFYLEIVIVGFIGFFLGFLLGIIGFFTW